MHYFKKEIVLQEVPGEISLCYFICGCPLHCKGCHSSFTWNEQTGYHLNIQDYQDTLERYKSYVSCILFMGGEWHENELIHLLHIAKEKGLKTCLYTGLDDVSIPLKNKLTYLKTGSWIPELGSLNSSRTNQRMILLKTGECLNPCFQREVLVG